MADPYADRPASRTVLLEIRDDREVVEQGHRFLDEKRVMLAQAILERLESFGALLEETDRAARDAGTALAAALGAHGLDGLQVYPPPFRAEAPRPGDGGALLGVALAGAPALRGAAAERPAPALPTREAEECARAFRALIETALEEAVALGNLERLAEAYRETDRRARALEDVVLPEIRAAEDRMEDHLEAAELEEAVRLRLFARGR